MVRFPLASYAGDGGVGKPGSWRQIETGREPKREPEKRQAVCAEASGTSLGKNYPGSVTFWLTYRSSRHRDLRSSSRKLAVAGCAPRLPRRPKAKRQNALTTGRKSARLATWSLRESAKKAERRGGTRVPLGKAWAGRQSSWARAKDLPLPPRALASPDASPAERDQHDDFEDEAPEAESR